LGLMDSQNISPSQGCMNLPISTSNMLVCGWGRG
jgi:hypothetical protein